MNINFWIDNKEYRLNIEEKSEICIQVTLGQKRYLVFPEYLCSNELLLNIDGRIYDAVIDVNSSCYSVCINGKYFRVEKKSASRILDRQTIKQKRRDIRTSMPGKIVKVLMNNGEEARKGQAVLVLEAMKMENEIKSPQPGIIKGIKVKAGDHVEAGTILFSVE